MKRLSWRLTILAAALAACTGSASAQTTNCSGTLAPGTYLNVTVPANTICFLPGSGTVTVTNNVVVESGASLAVAGDVAATIFINGSLLGRDAANIALGSDPSGKVHILGMVNLTGTTSEIVLFGVSIGNILFIANSTAGIFQVAANNVGGSVLVRDNTSSQGIAIEDNTIGGSLICLGNTPAPVGGGNTVGLAKAGQCASL